MNSNVDHAVDEVVFANFILGSELTMRSRESKLEGSGLTDRTALPMPSRTAPAAGRVALGRPHHR